MIPLDIQYELKKRGIMQKDIAQDLGLSENTVSKVINKIIISDRIMRAVAQAIERDHHEVFPEYYNAPPKRSTSKVGQDTGTRVTNNP